MEGFIGDAGFVHVQAGHRSIGAQSGGQSLPSSGGSAKAEGGGEFFPEMGHKPDTFAKFGCSTLAQGNGYRSIVQLGPRKHLGQFCELIARKLAERIGIMECR